MRLCLFFVLAVVCPFVGEAQLQAYRWLETYHLKDSIPLRIEPPEGFVRRPVERGSWQHWLRYLYLRPDGTPIVYYNGDTKTGAGHFAVVDIDIGTEDLQFNADAVIRLRAEYLYSTRRFGDLKFNLTCGEQATFAQWIRGYRPHLAAHSYRMTWRLETEPDASYASFRAFTEMVMLYAGSASLNTQLEAVDAPAQIAIGDVFIQPGFPGHAVIVVDVAHHLDTGQPMFLLAQSLQPTQSIHLLRAPPQRGREPSPWFALDAAGELQLGSRRFGPADLKRFPRHNIP